MATIKVQSAEDITRAYLKTLGFKKDGAGAAKAALAVVPAGNPDIPAVLDDILLSKAREIFAADIDDDQLTALFKYCFIACGGAKKWGGVIFADEVLPKDLITAMVAAYPDIAPAAAPSKMKPQKIESHTVIGVLKNLFKKRKK